MSILLELSNVAKGQAASLAEDPRFESLLKRLEHERAASVKPPLTLAVLKALERLGVTQNNMAVQNLENSLLFKSRTAPMKDLVMILSYVQGRTTSDQHVTEEADSLRLRIQREVVRAFERRWVEIIDGKVFAGLLHYPECFSQQFLNRVDDRITETAESLLPADLVLVSIAPVQPFLCFPLCETLFIFLSIGSI
jgi:hypothetical protein